MEWIEPVTTFAAVLLGASVANWQAKAERRAQRINTAVGAYRELLERRNKTVKLLREIAALRAQAPKADLSAGLGEARKCLEAVEAAVWIVMTADSINWRTTLCVNVYECLEQMVLAMEAGDLAKFNCHSSQESLAYVGVGKGLEFLSKMLPELPASQALERDADAIRTRQIEIQASFAGCQESLPAEKRGVD